MAVQVLETEITPALDEMLTGLKDTVEASLWVFPGSDWFTAEEFAKIAQSFGDLRCIVWSTQGIAVGKLKGRTRDPGRIFAEAPSLSAGVVVRTTSEFVSQATKLYSGVAWLLPSGFTELVELLSRSTGGADSTISFIPNSRESAEDWTAIVGGLDWLWHCHNWIYNEPQPAFRADAVVLSYVGLTIRLGGVPGLVVESLESKDLPRRGIVFYGSSKLLQTVAYQLADGNSDIPLSAFSRWIDRGATLKILE